MNTTKRPRPHQPCPPTPIVVLASGQGTLLQAIAAGAGSAYTVTGVVCDRECPAADWARNRGFDVAVVPYTHGCDRSAWNNLLADAVAAGQPSIVVSAGFMKIVGPEFIARFPGRIINTHPALLPSFPGAHAVADALSHGVKVTGCTVHEIDEGVDTGRIVAQQAVEVRPGDTEDSLHERIKQQERALIVRVLSAADPLNPDTV